MYRVRSYPFVFIENRVGKMVVIIASVMMQPYWPYHGGDGRASLLWLSPGLGAVTASVWRQQNNLW